MRRGEYAHPKPRRESVAGLFCVYGQVLKSIPIRLPML
ncbi:UNVERIFIED_ORG: hypothetical protein J2740_000788 [Rhizobium nepotum]|jgi:hypothetical protein|nr:hypothetical protein [Rhizobium nepotum]